MEDELRIQQQECMGHREKKYKWSKTEDTDEFKWKILHTGKMLNVVYKDFTLIVTLNILSFLY